MDMSMDSLGYFSDPATLAVLCATGSYGGGFKTGDPWRRGLF